MTGLETLRLLPAHLDQPVAFRVLTRRPEFHDHENIAITELPNLADLVDHLIRKVAEGVCAPGDDVHGLFPAGNAAALAGSRNFGGTNLLTAAIEALVPGPGREECDEECEHETDREEFGEGIAVDCARPNQRLGSPEHEDHDDPDAAESTEDLFGFRHGNLLTGDLSQRRRSSSVRTGTVI